MKIFKWVLIVLAVIALLLAAFLWYLGAFSSLKAYESVKGPYLIAYERSVGPYAKTGPIFEKVYNELKADGIETTRGLGIYYDDPSTVPAEKLRSDCGIVIEPKARRKFWRVSRKFKNKWVRRSKCIVVEFPIKNALSYMIGPMKAYPALMKHAEAKGYKTNVAYEIYDEPNGKIYFIMPIKR